MKSRQKWLILAQHYYWNLWSKYLFANKLQYRNVEENQFHLALLCADGATSSQKLRTIGAGSQAAPHLTQRQQHSPSIFPEPSPGEDTHCTGSLEFDSSSSSKVLAQDTSSGPSPSSSPEMMMDHMMEDSLDSEIEHDGIFLNFSKQSSGGSADTRDSSKESVAWHTDQCVCVCGCVQTSPVWCRSEPRLTFLKLLFSRDSRSSGNL